MATQYSHKHFFRNMPNTDLNKYFNSKNIDLKIDFDKPIEKNDEVIFNSFLGLFI